jgi:cysteine desulfurase/selenocysteine lyase
MSYGVKIREYFPYFLRHPQAVYLDNAATVQKPQPVIEEVNLAMAECYAPIHRGVYPLSELATQRFEAVRSQVTQLLGAAACEIIFTPSATYSLNLIVFAWAYRVLKKGDVVVLTVAEHHANLLPWQELSRTIGVTLRFLPVIDGLIDVSVFEKLCQAASVKVIAFPSFANSTGMPLPVDQLLQIASQYGVYSVLDASQSVAYDLYTLKGLSADFIVFSGHKFGAPTGVGVLRVLERCYAHMRPYIFGGGMVHEVSYTDVTFAQPPYCFEPGTPPYESVCGLGAALSFYDQLDMPQLILERRQLMNQLIIGLQTRTRMHPVGTSTALLEHSHVFAFTHPTIHAHDIAALLGQEQIAVRAGHHCAQPFAEHLGVQASVRVSFFWYSTAEDVERLLCLLERVELLLG